MEQSVSVPSPVTSDFSIYGLVMHADPVVKSVLVILVLASVTCWAIIFEKAIRPASFYVPDSSADNTPPETGLATADTNSAAAKGAGGLTGMLQRMQSLGYADSPTGSSR